MKKFKFGFTLAEVLITLGIIGVVAAIVMPSVMINHTYKTVGVKLAKFVSQLESSTRPFVVQNGMFSSNDSYSNVNAYFEESFLLKNTNLQAQTINETDSDGHQVSREVISFVIQDGEEIARNSTEEGWTGAAGDIVNDSAYNGNLVNIKDGTSFIVYPLADYKEHESIDPYKVGEVVFGVTFAPKVNGLPATAQKSFDFVVTDLGFVYPNENNDKCTKAIYNSDFLTNASFFKEGAACAKGKID